MAEIKQFNFKISATLLEQLRKTAVAKDTTVTELIIQGIHQVLGIIPSPKPDDIEFGIYKKLDELEQKLQDFEGYQSLVDLKVAGQIEDVQKRIAAIESFSPNTVADIARSIYKEIEEEKGTQLHVDIDSSIDTELDSTSIEALPAKAANTIPDVDRSINISAKEAQLSLLPPSQISEELTAKIRVVNSAELVNILQQVNPRGKWNSDKLTNLRRSKKYQGNWHNVGNYKFKYAGGNQEGSKFNKHLWQLITPDEEKPKA